MEANMTNDKAFLESLVSLEHSRRTIGRSTALMSIVKGNDNAIFVTSTPSYAKAYGIANRQILSPSAFVRAVTGGKLKDKIVIVDHFVLTWKLTELLDNDAQKQSAEAKIKIDYLQGKFDKTRKELEASKVELAGAAADIVKLQSNNQELKAKLTDLVGAHGILQTELAKYSNMTFLQRLKFLFSKPSVLVIGHEQK